MKKGTVITLIILLIVLLFPLPMGIYKDGGTRVYQSLTYKLVIWNKMVDDGIYHKTSIYWFPNNFKGIDELWDRDHEEETSAIINAVSDKTFVREKGGFGGDFTITLNSDGTYSYYEGLLSSYMGSGYWDVENGKIVLNETGGYEAYFVFALKDGNLVFLDESSKSFLYVKVEPGDLFIPQN